MSRVTKESLICEHQIVEQRLLKRLDERAEEAKTYQRKLADAEYRESQIRAELADVVAQTDANRERDRDALLTAENRVCELEAALVSLAVRVA